VTQKGILFFSQLAGKYFIQRLCGRCASHSAVLMGTIGRSGWCIQGAKQSERQCRSWITRSINPKGKPQ